MMRCIVMARCVLVAATLIFSFGFVVTGAFAESSWQHDPVLERTEPTIHSVLDQSQTTENGGGYFWAERYLAQTFTAGMSAQLAHIDLKIDTWTGLPSVPSTISVVNTLNGVPSGAVIGSVDVSGFSYGWNSIDFMAENVYLTSGTLYGIVLSNDDPSTEEPTNGLAIQWYDNPYTRGEVWKYTPVDGWERFNGFGDIGEADAAFETWMVPEPSTAALGIIGLLGLAFFCWQSKR